VNVPRFALDVTAWLGLRMWLDWDAMEDLSGTEQNRARYLASRVRSAL
jgi:hypothetical protein